MPSARTLVLVVALGGVLGGCGTTGDSDGVRGTVSSFLQTCAHDQGTRSIQILIQSGQNAFLRAGSPARGCARILRLPGAAASTAARFLGARVDAVHVHGTEASAAIDVRGTRSTVELSYGEEGWRLDGPG